MVTRAMPVDTLRAGSAELDRRGDVVSLKTSPQHRKADGFSMGHLVEEGAQ